MSSVRRMHSIAMVGLCMMLAVAFACKQEPSSSTQGAGANKTPESGTPSGSGQVAKIPAPQPVEVSNLVVAVRVNRMDQVLPDLQALVSQVVPTFTADTVKAQIGVMLSDPTLQNLDMTRNVLIGVFNVGEGEGDAPPAGPPVVGAIPVLNDQYEKIFQSQGALTHLDADNNVLLVSMSEQAMVAARQALPTLAAKMKESMTSDLSVYVDAAGLMTQYKDDINEFMEGLIMQMEQAGEMAGQPGMAGQMQMAAGQMRVLLGVVEDLKSLEFNVSLSRQGVLLGMLLSAKSGSDLAALLNTPGTSSADMLDYLPATGAIVGHFSGDESGKVGEYMGAKVDAAMMAGEDTTPEQRQAFKDMMMRSMQMNRGGAFDLFSPGGTGLSGIVVSKVADEQAYLDLMKSMPDLMEKSGLKAMYDEAGMTLTIELQENVRTHNDVAIHKYIQTMDMPATAEMPPQFAPLMNMFTNIQYEIAVVNNYSITDMGTQKMDEVIDAIKAGKSISSVKLVAEQKYPANGDVYVDIHIPRIGMYVVGMMQAMMGPMGDQMGPQMAKVTSALTAMDVEPITVFMGSGMGNLQFQLNVPMDPIVQVMNTVQQAMQPPAPEPVAP